MLFLFFSHCSFDGVLKALCWTFIHSLWQGMLAAILAGVIIISTRKAKASLRYNLLVFLFASFLLVVSTSFIFQLNIFTAQKGNDPLTAAINAKDTVPFLLSNSFAVVNKEAIVTKFTVYLTEHAAVVVLVWFLFFVAKCLQVFYGLYYINRLTRTKVYVPLDAWNQMTIRLSKRLGIRKPVVLLESGLVDVPLTIGHFKAIILIPIGLMANLTLEQVEAVLLHELSHIRRNDYLINLLQSSSETIFFFNPAFLWISSLIRQEREACCDDKVLANIPQQKTYFEALASFQDYTLARSGHAMALTSKRNYLLDRIRRMLAQENKKLNIMEKTYLAFGIIAVSIFGFITKQETPVVHPLPVIANANAGYATTQPYSEYKPLAVAREPKQNLHKPLQAKKDTVPVKQKNVPKQQLEFSNFNSTTHNNGKTRTYEAEVTDSQGKKYYIKKVNDSISEFSVDGKEASMEEHADIINRIDGIEYEHWQDAAYLKEEKVQINERAGEQKKQAALLKEQKLMLKAQEDELKKQRNVEMKEMSEQQAKQSALLKEQKLMLKAQEDELKKQSNVEMKEQSKQLKKQEILLKEQKLMLKAQEVDLNRQRKVEMKEKSEQKKQKVLLKEQKAMPTVQKAEVTSQIKADIYHKLEDVKVYQEVSLKEQKAMPTAQNVEVTRQIKADVYLKSKDIKIYQEPLLKEQKPLLKDEKQEEKEQ